MKKEYMQNRENFKKEIPDNTVVIVFAGQEIRQSEDEAYPFTVNRNFYYLTGINEDNDVIVLSNINNEYNEILFINEYDEYMAKWVGRKLLEDEVKELSGIENIKCLKEFDSFIDDIASKKYDVMLETKANLFHEPYGQALKLAKHFMEKGVNVTDCHDLFTEYRNIKSDFEVNKVKEAIAITNKGIEAMMKNSKPGMYEYQIESYFDQQIKFNGASGFAFKTIAACGKNGCTLHYSQNNTITKDNELILCDLGAEYDLYKADITRTFPVNGKFTERQKEIYNIVLKGQQLVIDSVKPGLTTVDLNNILVDYYKVELKRIGLIKDDSEVRKYYFHGVSHHLGLDTHDVAIRGKKLTPGCIITVEPGLYISEEEIGIRIEDDVLVTENGCEVLSKDIIKTVDEIEAFMNK